MNTKKTVQLPYYLQKLTAAKFAKKHKNKMIVLIKAFTVVIITFCNCMNTSHVTTHFHSSRHFQLKCI